MHSLFWRAAQAQSSCPCRLCLHSGRSVIRRSTNTTSRRKVSAADVFTACYTTILGTATIIDAQRKEARKKELDERLAKARASLGSSGVRESPGNQQAEGSFSSDPGTANPGREDGGCEWGATQPSAAHALLQELGTICEITRRPVPRPSWLQIQIEWAHVEAAIAAEERDPECTLREPKNSEQLRRTTLTIVDLVNQLIRRSLLDEDAPGENSASTSTSTSTREKCDEVDDDITKELKDILRAPHYPGYLHPSEDPEYTAKTRSLLGESLRRIFNQATNAKEAVAKICYNLLISTVPPSIHAYNILIAGFNRIQRPDLAQVVVDSYINKTTWPATQQTAVCLLNHYRGANQIEGLRGIIRRMRGVNGDGLHFRIISKDAIYSRDWLAWAIENCASRKYAYVERAQRTDDVFNSIIKGRLHYGELGHASMAFVACLRTGSSVAVQTLQDLFTACLSAVDHSAARRLIVGFAKNIQNAAIMIDRIVHQESAIASRKLVTSLSHLLDICRFPLDFAPITDIYRRMLQKVKTLLVRAQIELEMREMADLFAAVIKDLSSSGPFVSRLDDAIATLDSARQSRQKIDNSFVNLSRLAEIMSIYRRYSDLELRIKTTTALVKVAILKIKTGYNLDPSTLLNPKEPLVWWHHLDRHDSLLNALQNIQVYRGPMTQEDIRMQLLRRLPDPVLLRRFENSGYPENIAIRTLTTFYTSKFAQSIALKYEGYGPVIRQLERELAEVENNVRAILFAPLNCDIQRKLRFQYPNFYKMPFKKLIKYQLRRSFYYAQVPDRQADALEPRDEENPAVRASESQSMVLGDAADADEGGTENAVPKPAISHTDPQKEQCLSRSIIELRPAADPSESACPHGCVE